MIEIIALIFLTRHIGIIAEKKGLSKGRWKLYTVLAWFTAEFSGFIIAFQFIGKDRLLDLMLIGLTAAFGGYLFVKATLDKMPDSMDEDINRIGDS